MNLIHLFLIPCLFFHGNGLKPILHVDEVMYYDRFDESVTILYDQSTAWIPCSVPNGTCDQFDEFYLVNRNGEPRSYTSCVDAHVVRLPVDINNKLLLGEYKCGFRGEVSQESVKFSYRLCADEDDTCRNTDPKCEGKFCFVTEQDDQSSCSNVDNVNICEIHSGSESFFCPAEVTSLCQAAVLGENKNVWANLLSGSNDCNDTFPYFTCGDHQFPKYDEACVIDRETEISIHYNSSILGGFIVSCAISKHTEREENENENDFDYDYANETDTEPETHYTIFHPPKITIRKGGSSFGQFLFRNKFLIEKLTCDIQWPYINVPILSMSVVLVTFPSDLKLNINTKYNRTNDNFIVTCQFDDSYKMDSVLMVRNYWTIHGPSKEIIQDTKLILKYTDTREFFCHGEFIYKTCTPHQKFVKDYSTPYKLDNSSRVMNDSELNQSTTSQGISTSTTTIRIVLLGIITTSIMIN